MTEDAQSAFLKTLEEPPAGTVLILTAADEERLLPTIRSRCVRVRLGPVPRTDVEALLVEVGAADPPLAARLARLAAGRPGDAVAFARSPDSLRIRDEVGRTLLDLAVANRADRLRLGRDLLARASELTAALRPATRAAASVPKGRRRAAAAAAADAAAMPAETAAPGDGGSGEGQPAGSDVAAAGGGGTAVRAPASERRAAALALVAIWREVARDLALVGMGRAGDVRQIDLLDDLEAAAKRLPATFAPAQLRRLDQAGERLEGNVSPELVIDGLALAWTA